MNNEFLTSAAGAPVRRDSAVEFWVVTLGIGLRM